MRPAETLGPIVLATLPLLWVLAPTSAAALNASCSSSGKDATWLTCDFGLELWEEGKKSSVIFQQWHLSCDWSQGRATSCRLERTLFVNHGEGAGGARVTVHHHATSEGTLRLLAGNWKEGRLEFEVVYPRGERMPVLIRLKRRFKDKDLGLFDIESFEAKDVVQTVFTNEIEFQHWRIPEYTYTVNSPMLLRGRKSAADKRRDDLTTSLSPSDRSVMERALRKCLEPTWLEKEPAKSVIQSYEPKAKELEAKIKNAREGERFELFAQQDAMNKEMFGKPEVRKAMKDEMENCLAGAGMSRAGREAVANHWLRELYSEFDK